VKNAFAAAQALAVLTLPAKHAETLSDRITALARAHDLLDQQLSKHEWIGLDELVAAELDPYRQQGVERIVMSGPPVECSGREGTALGLVLNELATNALKYGALSTRSGKVEVSWRVEGDHLILEWRESDGPEVKAATIESFGSRLLKRLVEGQLGGTIRRQLAPTGAVCVIGIPAGDRGLP
jgi:two-component sensor histidine kinase